MPLVKNSMGVVFRYRVDTSINDASRLALELTRPNGSVVTIDSSASALEIGTSTTAVYDDTLSATATFVANKYVQCVFTSVSGSAVLHSAGWYRPRVWYYRSASGIALPTRAIDDNEDVVEFYVET